MIKSDVNKINTPTWVRVNEDARKELYKKDFLNMYGGKFVGVGRHGYVQWEEVPDYSDVTDKYVVLTPENKMELIEVFSQFCKENNLNKAAMYGTLNGVRNHHKGFKLVKTPE